MVAKIVRGNEKKNVNIYLYFESCSFNSHPFACASCLLSAKLVPDVFRSGVPAMMDIGTNGRSKCEIGEK